MPYAGGKYFQAARIAAFLDEHFPGRPIEDRFCGSLVVPARLRGRVTVASDICRPLITMWQALQDGWIPPDFVSAEDYAHHKSVQDPHDPMTAFVGFWHSFAGKWFGGYQRYWNGEPHPMPKPGGAAKAVLKAIRACNGIRFRCCDYREHGVPEGHVLYLDPPYDGTTLPGERQPFDSPAFWNWVREQEARGIPSLVSESTAPDDFEPLLILKAAKRMSAKNNDGHRIEAVWRLKGAA